MTNEQEINRKLAEWVEQDKKTWLFWKNEKTLEPKGGDAKQ